MVEYGLLMCGLKIFFMASVILFRRLDYNSFINLKFFGRKRKKGNLMLE